MYYYCYFFSIIVVEGDDDVILISKLLKLRADQAAAHQCWAHMAQAQEGALHAWDMA